MSRLTNRAERLRQIERLLYNAPPDGMSVIQIAERCDVHRTTVYRDIRSLEADDVPVWQEEGRFGVLRDRYLTTVRVTLHEAMALYLSTRLLSAHSDEHNPNVVSALEKLAVAMPEYIGGHIARTADLVRDRRSNEHYRRVLETLTQAWADRRRMRIWHRSSKTGKVQARDFDPYFIEPSGVGYACYAIGHDHLRRDIRIFKVERVERAELRSAQYVIPDSFDPYRYLSTAWGIMGGGEEIEVRLRFSPAVTYRVKESEWHLSQEIEGLADGGCVLSVRVSHTVEMLPWIRGWGADCEVLEPEELREWIAEEVGRMAEIYRRES